MRPPFPRLLMTAVALVFLGYGAVLAWHAHSATAVLAVGAIFLFLGLVLPTDWDRLVFRLPGASLEVERAKAAQEALASLPEKAQRELLPVEGLPTEEPAEEEGDEPTDGGTAEAAE